MKYFLNAVAYLKKAWWYLILLVLVPSIVAGILSTPFWEVSFLMERGIVHLTSKELFMLLFGDSWQNAWPVIVIAVVQIIFFSLAVSLTERHFRVGKMSFNHPFRSINNCIWPVALTTGILSVVSILWRFVVYGVTVLISFLGMVMNAPAEMVFVFMCVFALALFVVHLMIITLIVFWPIVMIEYGYGLRDSVVYVFRALNRKFWKIFLSLLLPVIVFIPVVMVLIWLRLPFYGYCIIWSVFFLALNVYSLAFIMTNSFDLLELERRDIQKFGY